MSDIRTLAFSVSAAGQYARRLGGLGGEGHSADCSVKIKSDFFFEVVFSIVEEVPKNKTVIVFTMRAVTLLTEPAVSVIGQRERLAD